MGCIRDCRGSNADSKQVEHECNSVQVISVSGPQQYIYNIRTLVRVPFTPVIYTPDGHSEVAS